MNDEAKYRELQQKAEALHNSPEFPGTYDNSKIIDGADGRPVLVARRHDDHTTWDEIAK